MYCSSSLNIGLFHKVAIKNERTMHESSKKASKKGSKKGIGLALHIAEEKNKSVGTLMCIIATDIINSLFF